ncbi:CHAT domain-containing protein [uncultured Erythrobacter sp.]|uniref:CHAT domain-containing protein n=1 Tax=uncultured Erythrobacter sp. TaxID=263913 RepID=UPI002613D79B|nr:CHAT domain-containing protein [uncultured Erythrobacter sp.]
MLTGLVSTQAQANPLELCQPSAAGSLSSAPDAETLTAAAANAESILAVGLADLTAGDRALEELGSLPSTSSSIDRASLSAYCSAAGEAMRIAQEGSATRAQSFLIGALIHAEDAEDREMQANAAYRLALVSAALPVRPNARSARASRSAEVQRFVSTRSADAAASSSAPVPCVDLLLSDLSFQSNWAVASKSLECSIAATSDLEQPLPVARAKLQLARVTLTEAGRLPEARGELMREAANAALDGVQSAASITSADARFEMLARLTESALDAGIFDDPRMLGAVNLLAASSDGSASREAWRMALMGRLLLGGGELEGAASYFRQAILLESQAAQPLRIADWHLLLAEADPVNRGNHVMQAYRVLEEIRPLLPRYDTVTQETMFQLRMRPVFTAAVDVQLENAASEQNSGSIVIAQQIVESFRQAEIQSAFGADCVPPRDPVSLSQLQDGEILLYPILLDDRLELIYAAKRPGSEVEYRRVTSADGASRDRIEQLVRDTTYSLGYGLDDDWIDGSKELHRLLIEPIDHLLGDDSSLIIIPDGILRRLPFAALQNEAGELLIERADISVSPSLAYTQPGDSERDRPQVLAASLSKSVELTRGNFAELRGTKREGDIAAGLGNADEQSGAHLENFTASDLREALGSQPVDILHLATHASFNGRSDRSFIVADGEAILLSELRDLLGANQLRGGLISLIILSACETALGDDQASMGLAGSAVQAGAESAVASLWEVDDAGTLELMTHFYRFYAEGQGRAEAMRNAQLTLIRSDNVYSDPRVWAAFTLLGAWR